MQGDRSKSENKRLARCGSCEGCNAKDCGSCVNCLDKPKFQGPGVKKQACVMRRCVQILARGEDKGDSPRKRAKAVHRSTGSVDPPAFLLASFDFDEHFGEKARPFANEVDLGSLLMTGDSDDLSVKLGRKNSGGSPRGDGRRQVARLQRCGKCGPCKATDCGTCQNCADKPRFGGKGVKKQACVARRCVSLTKQEDETTDAADAMEVISSLGPLPSHSLMCMPSEYMTAEEAVAAGNGSPTGVIEGPLSVPSMLEEKAFHDKAFSDSTAHEQPPTWHEVWGELSHPWEEPPPSEADGLPVCDLVTEPGLMTADTFESLAPVDTALRLDDWLSEATAVAAMA
mmetsp:Transcript_31600/g.96715  ORF Transcript_31600/g.96715 Transcript_31600/m.96715 type:complete len:342 (+) Transcript_31600:51-1076(+)